VYKIKKIKNKKFKRTNILTRGVTLTSFGQN